MENMPGAWPVAPKLSILTPPQSPKLSFSAPPQSTESSFTTPPESPKLSLSTPPQSPNLSFTAPQSLFPSHMRSLTPHRCTKRRRGNVRSLSRMMAMENQRDQLRQQLRDQNDQLNVHMRELRVTSFRLQMKEAMITGLEEDKLALERRIEEELKEHAERADKLQIAEFRADLYEARDKKGDDKLICKLREDVNAHWLRANNAEDHVRRLEQDLTHANSELQHGHSARNEIRMLQEKLNTNVTNSQKANLEIQELRTALEASDNVAREIHQQAVAHIQSIEEAASQEQQRLMELGTNMEARAHEAVSELEEKLRMKQQRLEEHKTQANNADARAHKAERELQEKLEEKQQQLDAHKTRADDAEAKVQDLQRKILNLETAAPQQGQAAENPSSNHEADCALTDQAERLERELAAAIELLEELIGSSGMDTACRDALDSLVFTNQSFTSLEAEFQDYHAATVDAVNSILEDAVPNLDSLNLIENTGRPVLVRQLKEAYSMRQRIDVIVEDAQLLGNVYLDEEDTEKIKEMLRLPRTLSGQDAAATLISPTSPPSSPPSSPSPSPPPSASRPNTSTPAPLYNPPRPQQPTSTAPLYLPGLHLTAPTASPTTGAPPPFNPLWDTPQPAAPSLPAPSALASVGSSLLPLLNNPPQATSAASSSDSDSDSDDDVLPEAFAGQYDEESSDEDEAPRAPPVGQRPIRQPLSVLRRRRGPENPNAAVFM